MAGYYFPVLGGGSITSGFGPRVAPTAGASTYHGGIDIAAPGGTPVIAPIGGSILNSGFSGASGNRITMQGDDGLTYGFRHLAGVAVGQGARVVGGQQIGAVGSTGRSTGNHLHFDVSSGGVKINPNKILNSAAKSALSKGLDIAKKGLGLGVASAANAIVPGSGAILGGLGLGGGGPSIIEQLQNWIRDSGFFQRVALALFAFIILFAGFYLLKGSAIQSVVNKVKG